METQPSFEQKLKKLKMSLKRRLKTAKKYLAKVTLQLQTCQNWALEKHQAELLQANLYQMSATTRELTVVDWETHQPILLRRNLALKPYEEVSKRFKRAKKLQLGLSYAEKEHEKAVHTVNELIEATQVLSTCDTMDALIAFMHTHHLQEQSTKAQVIKKNAKPYWEYVSEANISIWVGKSAQMNDQLTFKCAAGNNPWLHVTEFSGSHVVIHLPQGKVLDNETQQDALQLALHHSKAKNQQAADISCTLVKYVKRAGKEKGKVQIAREKRVFTRTDQTRLDRLAKTRVNLPLL